MAIYVSRLASCRRRSVRRALLLTALALGCRVKAPLGPDPEAPAYLYRGAVMGTLQAPQCIELAVGKRRARSVRLLGPRAAIDIARIDDPAQHERWSYWNAQIDGTARPCGDAANESTPEELKARCGRVWPRRTSVGRTIVAEDREGHTHAAFVVDHGDRQEVRYVRCGDGAHPQTLAAAARIDALTLALGQDSTPVVALHATGLSSPPARPAATGAVVVAEIERFPPFSHDPMLGLAAQSCAAAYARAPRRLRPGKARPPDDEARYCDWLAQRRHEPPLRAEEYFRQACQDPMVGTSLEPACLMMARIAFGIPLVTDLRWRHRIDDDTRARFDFVTVFGENDAALSKSLSCSIGRPVACFHQNIIDRAEHGDPGDQRLYQRPDGTAVDVEDSWDVSTRECEAGRDDRACTSIAIAWQIDWWNAPDPRRPWSDRAAASLQQGCDHGIALACAQAWSIRWQEAAASNRLPAPQFDALLERACAEGVTDACDNLAVLRQHRETARADQDLPLRLATDLVRPIIDPTDLVSHRIDGGADGSGALRQGHM